MIRVIDHQGNGYGVQAEITRRKGVNGEKSLTGIIYTNEEVLHGVDRGWKLEFENERYAFTFALPKDTGSRIELEFDAVHEFFFDMDKSSQNDLLNDGSHTFIAYLDFIFRDTPYSYSLEVDVRAFEKQSFGQKNRLDLFYDIIDTAGVEFSVNGSVIRIVERVGNDLSTVVKKGFNLNELRLEKNIGDFVTYQKGFGAWFDEEDHSQGRLEVEYLSPLSDIYGKLDADPVVDERYSVRDNLLVRLRNNVEGSYQISVQIDMEDLTRAGYEYKQPHEGDSIMAINKDLGFQRKIRIVSYETDFDIEGNILDHRITCNSIGMVEESIYGNASLKSSVRQLQTDVELQRQQITEARVAADGKSMNYYGPVEPSPDENKLSIGDTWFDSSGEETIIKVWNGVEWRKSGADVDAIRRQIEQAQSDIQAAQQTADEAVERINTDIAGKFTSLDEEILTIEGISNTAQANASTALSQSLDALGDASLAITNAQTAVDRADSAISSIQDINVEIDEINGTLDLKADSSTVNALDGTVSELSTEVNIMAGELSAKADRSTVDTISGIVDSHTMNIQANADALALKANQDTVDTLAGTVSTLGTDIGVVAGQISSKVWMADIDDIEVGGRNLALGTTNKMTYYNEIGLYSGTLVPKNTSQYIYTLDDLGVKAGDWLTASIYIGAGGGYGSGLRIDNQTGVSQHYSPTVSHSYTSVTFQVRDIDEEFRFYLRNSNNNTESYAVEAKEFKLEKGNKATDWTPAPEDTLARFDHIETEWTQTFDSFSQTVSGIDGRVTQHQQTIDTITTTLQEVESDIDGNTTKINQTIDTVTTHTQTIANIETDLDDKVEVSKYNQTVSTVNSTVQRIGNAEGKITQIETSVSGLQTTVAGKASQSQVTQLASGLSSVVTDLGNLEIGGRNLLIGTSEEEQEVKTASWSIGGWDPGLTIGEEYTFSFDIRSENATYLQNVFLNSSNNGFVPNHPITKEWTRVQFTFEWKGGSYFGKEISPHVYPRPVHTGTYVSRIKLEKGNKATDWTPAPEDMATMEYTTSQISQLSDNINLRVAKNDVINQINISNENILIQSENILLDGDVTVRGTAWMDGAVLKNLSVDGAKIADATIGSAKIANLDVGKISGNTTNFVQSNWNSYAGGNVRVTGDGIVSTASDGSQALIQNGTILAYQPSGEGIGYIGYDQEGARPFYTITQSWGANFRIRSHHGGGSFRSDFEIYAGSNETYIRTEDLRHTGNLARFSGNVTVDGNLNMNDSHLNLQQLNFRYGSWMYDDHRNSNLQIVAGNKLRLYVLGTSSVGGAGGNEVMAFDNTYGYMYRNLSMEGNNVTNQSDARLKTDISTRQESSLEKINKFNFVDFRWLKDGRSDFGVIAQQVQQVAPELILEGSDGYLSLNNSLLNMMTSHGLQELSAREANTNLLASENRTLIEKQQDKIKELEQRIEELESA